MLRTKETIYEELLVLRCRRGEQAALEELVRTWEKRLFYFIRRLVDTEQDAWDVLQQSWLRVLAGIGRLRDPSALRPWLYRIARHTAFNHGQVRATYRRFLEDYPAPPAGEDSGSRIPGPLPCAAGAFLRARHPDRRRCPVDQHRCPAGGAADR